MEEIYIMGLELPGKVRGVTIEQQDNFIIFINTNLCEETQKKAIEHELKHIRANHFYKSDPLVINELEAGVW